MSTKQIYRILSPNKNHSKVTAGVGFYQGVGYTENEKIIPWFEEHGYVVQKTDSKDDTQLVADLTAQIETLNTQIGELEAEIEELKTLPEGEEEDDDEEGTSPKPNSKGKGNKNIKISK